MLLYYFQNLEAVKYHLLNGDVFCLKSTLISIITSLRRLSEIRLNEAGRLQQQQNQQPPESSGVNGGKHFHRLQAPHHHHHSNKPFVSRTYIGGSATSSLALKIQRKNHQIMAAAAALNGSLSSLHETSLNSDAEDVRSSCSYRVTRPASRGAGAQSDVDEVRSGFIFGHHFLSEKENVHLFSSSLPRFDKYHETS